MANSLLLREEIGIGYERRQEIVDQAETRCFSPMESGQLANPYDAESFYLLTRDFAERLLPELHDAEDPTTVDVHSYEFTTDLDLGKRFSFLRTVARSLELRPDEVEPVAELLGIRAPLLTPAAPSQEGPKHYKLHLVQEGKTLVVPLSEEAVCQLAIDVAMSTHDIFQSLAPPAEKAV